jgi:ferredoxin
MPGTRREESGPAETQPLEVLSGSEALARVERAICAEAVARDPAVAEGLALAGIRAASLSNGVPPGVVGNILVRETSCVHHVEGEPGRERAGVFELAATSVQEAVDHCLVAHLLSRKLGRPGLCSLASSMASELHIVRLPGTGLVARLLDNGADVPESDAQASRIVELAREAFREVGQQTSRPRDVVQYAGEVGAELLLVGWGLEGARARELTQSLASAGVRAGALSVNLIRPFPDAAVRESLASARKVLVLEERGRGGALLARVRACVDEKVEVDSLESAPLHRLLGTLAEHLPGGIELQADATPTPLSSRLVVAPAGPWGEETSRQFAAAIGHLGTLRVDRQTRHHLGATVLAWGNESLPEEGRDVLLAFHPALLVHKGPLALLRQGAAVIVLSTQNASVELAECLPPEGRELILERELQLYWVPPPGPDEAGVASEDDRAASFVLCGAALGCLAGAEEEGDTRTVDAVALQLEATGQSEAARWLREGAQRVQRVEPAALDPKRHLQEVDFRTPIHLPRMPEEIDDPEEQRRWAERIRRFHRTGKGAISPASHIPVQPAVWTTLAESVRQTSHQPFVLVRSDDAEQPIVARALRDVLAGGLEALQGAGRGDRSIVDNLEHLRDHAARLQAQRDPGTDLETLLSETSARLVERIDIPREERGALADQLADLRRELPPNGVVLDLRADTPIRLYREVLAAVREPRHKQFGRDMEKLREQLRNLLEIDRMGSAEGRRPETLAATLGRSGSEYLDPEALARTLPTGGSSESMAPDRRARVTNALEIIERHLAEQDRPHAIFLRPPGMDLPLPETEQREHPDPLAAGVGVFDGVARHMAKVYRAVRVARLEVEDRYRPEVHDEILEDLDWEGFTEEELHGVPAVVAVTTGRRLRQRDQSSLSEALRSSRPVQVLVLDQVAPADEAEDLSRFHIDLGYLVVAHREAFAVASTLARPERLTEAFTQMARALRPAVALVHLPSFEAATWRDLLVEAALEGRARPEFRYDPDGGVSWATRFDLSDNPEPERAWPLHSIAHLEGGEAATLEVAFTFADAVALEPSYLRHLRIIPRVAWDDTQLPLADYLDQFGTEGGRRAVPYLWVLDEAGTLQRAVVTRELAMATADRLRSWRVLQELAGYENVFAERAAAAARERALAEAEVQRAALVEQHAEELERVRTETAQDSMERLAAVLLDPEATPFPTPALAAAPVAPLPATVAPLAATEPATITTVPAATEPAVVEEAPEEEALSFDEPYIDTPLCTTCNECTNINSRLFEYNSEKQAVIADASAGTFAELVKSAELCPARCIHPGKPRSDDSTATPELIERAAAFN